MKVTVRFCLALAPQTFLPLVLSLHAIPKEGTYYDILIINTDYEPELAESNLEQMLMIAGLYDFAEIHDLSNLRVCHPRNRESAVSWQLELISRHRHDARKIFNLKEEILKRARAILGERISLEFWCDEPIHYHTQVVRAAFPEAVYVKYPHGTNLEDQGSEGWMRAFWSKPESTAKRIRRYITNLVSGLKLVSPSSFQFDKSITLFQKTLIAPICVDISNAISPHQYNEIFHKLPLEFQEKFKKSLHRAMCGRPEMFLLLPWGIRGGDDLQRRIEWFTKALLKLRTHWEGRALVLKTHPSQISGPDKDFVASVEQQIGQSISHLDLPPGIPLELIISGIPNCYAALGDPSSSIQTVRRILQCPTFILNKSLKEFRQNRSETESNLVDEIISGSELI